MSVMPRLHVKFPRPVTAVHQIEVTSRCNLRCVYCPSRKIMSGEYPNRAAVDMAPEAFARTLEWVKHYVRAGTQTELNLAGIGESLLHDRFLDYLATARAAVGSAVRIVLATNGVVAHPEGLHETPGQYRARMLELGRAMAPYRPLVWVSLHRPEKAALTAAAFTEAGILGGVSADPSINSNDWAGQVEWVETRPAVGAIPCQWLREGKVFVFADGRIATCCLDAQALGVIGHVNDPIAQAKIQPYSLCKSCYQHINVADYDQFGAS